VQPETFFYRLSTKGLTASAVVAGNGQSFPPTGGCFAVNCVGGGRVRFISCIETPFTLPAGISLGLFMGIDTGEDTSKLWVSLPPVLWFYWFKLIEHTL
jgi:hypothetical protein